MIFRMTETLKERLERALVPDSECPYKLPAGWNWVRGEAIFEPQEEIEPEGESFRYIDREAIDVELNEIFGAKEILVRKAPRDARRKLHTGDTIFPMRNPSRPSIGFIDESLADCIASTDFFVCHPSELVHPRYLFLLMMSPYVVVGMAHRAKDNGDDILCEDDFMQFPFPLPSLAIQREIVETIDPLYAAENEKHKHVTFDMLDALEYLQTIYQMALSGTLTMEWRKENGVSFKEWIKEARLGDYYDVRVGCDVTTSENASGPKLLRLEDIQYGEVDWDHLARCNISEEDHRYFALHPGDIVIDRNGNLASERYLIKKDVDAVFASDLICLSEVEQGLLAEYLSVVFSFQPFWNEVKYLENENQKKGIDLESLRNLKLPLPSEEEQVMIAGAVKLMTGTGEKAIREFRDDHLRYREKKAKMLDKTFRGEWRELVEEYINSKQEEKSVDEIVEEAKAAFTGDFETDYLMLLGLNEKYKDREDSHEILRALSDVFAKQLESMGFGAPDEESGAVEENSIIN